MKYEILESILIFQHQPAAKFYKLVVVNATTLESRRPQVLMFQGPLSVTSSSAWIDWSVVFDTVGD